MTAAGHPGGVRAPRPASARWAAAVRFAQSMKFIRRGGIYPARGTPRRRKHPRVAAMLPPFCRAGVHARRTLTISKSDVCCTAGGGGVRAPRPTSTRAAAGNPGQTMPHKGASGNFFNHPGHFPVSNRS